MTHLRITHTTRIFTPVLMALMLMWSIGAKGESGMEQAFASMPDSIIPYLTKNNRLDCIDFIKNNMKAEVENLFGGKTVMTVMTDNYLKLQLNQITDVEMKIFKVEGKDSILCMAKTIKTPEADTEIKFFNLNWEEIDTITVTQDRKTSDMKSEPIMCEASLSKDDETITIKRRRFFSNDKELKNEELTEQQFKVQGSKFKVELQVINP